jgi:hypothetical protein
MWNCQAYYKYRALYEILHSNELTHLWHLFWHQEINQLNPKKSLPRRNDGLGYFLSSNLIYLFQKEQHNPNHVPELNQQYAYVYPIPNDLC